MWALFLLLLFLALTTSDIGHGELRRQMHVKLLTNMPVPRKFNLKLNSQADWDRQELLVKDTFRLGHQQIEADAVQPPMENVQKSAWLAEGKLDLDIDQGQITLHFTQQEEDGVDKGTSSSSAAATRGNKSSNNKFVLEIYPFKTLQKIEPKETERKAVKYVRLYNVNNSNAQRFEYEDGKLVKCYLDWKGFVKCVSASLQQIGPDILFHVKFGSTPYLEYSNFVHHIRIQCARGPNKHKIMFHGKNRIGEFDTRIPFFDEQKCPGNAFSVQVDAVRMPDEQQMVGNVRREAAAVESSGAGTSKRKKEKKGKGKAKGRAKGRAKQKNVSNNSKEPSILKSVEGIVHCPEPVEGGQLTEYKISLNWSQKAEAALTGECAFYVSEVEKKEEKEQLAKYLQQRKKTEEEEEEEEVAQMLTEMGNQGHRVHQQSSAEAPAADEPQQRKKRRRFVSSSHQRTTQMLLQQQEDEQSMMEDEAVLSAVDEEDAQHGEKLKARRRLLVPSDSSD